MVQDVRIRYKTDDSDLDKTDKKLEDISKEEQNVASNAKKMSDAIKKGAKESNESVKDLNGGVKAIGATIVAAFTVEKILAFSNEVIRVRGEFQKLEAVLTNTLGSTSKAQLALGQIKDFAAKTNFSVLELTQSYVKLANQGFIPTTNELRKLADLANSTGKQFDQLTEAIIDAQTGEFERLKEFGIRASKEGDNVTFAFKGVKTQVDFTNSAIRDYIVSLGDLNGVSGATEAISATLGGQVSNLGDAYDSLLNTIGIRLEPVLKGLIGQTSELLILTQKLLETDAEAGNKQFAQQQNNLAELTKKRVENQMEIDKILKKQYENETQARKAATEFVLADLKDQQKREIDLVRGLSIAETNSIRERTKDRIKATEQYYDEIVKKEAQLIAEQEEKLAKEREKAEKKRFEREVKATNARLRRIKHIEAESARDDEDISKDIEKRALEAQKENSDTSINLIQKEVDYRRAALDAKRDIQEQEIQALYNLSNVVKNIFGESAAGQVAALVLEKIAAVSTVLIKTSEAQASAVAQAALLPPGASEAYYAKQSALIQLNRSLALGGIAAATIPEINSFAKGGYTGEGNGQIDETGERVAGKVHWREFVFSREKTARFRPLFEAIHRGELNESDIVVKNSVTNPLDYAMMTSAYKSALKSQPRNEITIDERGFTRKVVSDTRKITMREKRYSSR